MRTLAIALSAAMGCSAVLSPSPAAGGDAPLADAGLVYEDARGDFARPGCGVVGSSDRRDAQTNGTTTVLSPTGYATPMWNLRLFSGGNDYQMAGVDTNGVRMVGAADIPINDQTLDAWRQTFANARANGALVTPRFRYDELRVSGCEPSDFGMILTHIGQIAGVLNEYADIVPSIECGIIGLWGEMHTSKYADDVYAPQIVRAWLDELDPRIKVQIRSPKDLFRLMRREVLGNPTGNVSAETVLARLRELDGWDRIGLYNDGYLGTVDDYGTWDAAHHFSRAQSVLWFSQLPHVPYGGELSTITASYPPLYSYTNAPFCAAQLVTNGFNQVEEWYRVHLSYLRGLPNTIQMVPILSRLPFSEVPFGFDGMETCGLVGEPFFAAMVEGGMGFGFAGMPDLHEWEGEPLLDFLRAHMGHRFVLRGSRLPASAAPGGTMPLSFEIENTGFADLFLPSKTEILLQSGGDRFWACPVSIDLGASVPSMSNATLSVSLQLPSSLAEGNWNVYLRTHVVIEGDSPSRAGQRTIRFANPETQWNASLGANLLGTVHVAGTAAAPGLGFRETGADGVGATAPQLVLSALPMDTPLLAELSDWAGGELCVFAPGASDIRFWRGGEEWPSTNGVAVLPDGDAALGIWSISYVLDNTTVVRDFLSVEVEAEAGHTWRLATRTGRLRAVCAHCGGERDPMPGFDRGLPGRLSKSIPATNAILHFASSSRPFTADPPCDALYPAFTVAGVPAGGARLGDLHAVTSNSNPDSYRSSNASGNLADRNDASYDPASQTVAIPAEGAYLTDIRYKLVNWVEPYQFATAQELSLNNPAATRGGQSAGLEDAELATLGLFTADPGFHVWFCDGDWTVLCETNGAIVRSLSGNFHTFPIPAASGLFQGTPPAEFASTDAICRPLRGWKRLDGSAAGWALGDVALVPDYAEDEHRWRTVDGGAGTASTLRCAVCGLTRPLPILVDWFDVRFSLDGYRLGADWSNLSGTAADGSWERPANDETELVETATGDRALSLATASPVWYVPTTASSNGVDLVVEGQVTVRPLASVDRLPGATSAGLSFVAESGGDGNHAAVSYGHAADGWHRLDGATPAVGDWVAWRMELDLSSAVAPRVRYLLDGEPLSDEEGAEWLPLDPGIDHVAGVGFLGACAVGDFRGKYAAGISGHGSADGPPQPAFGATDGGPALSFAVDPATGSPLLQVRIDNAAAGVYYTAFTSETLAGPFSAEGDSRRASEDGDFLFSIDATPSAKFIIVVAGDVFHRDGDPLPRCATATSTSRGDGASGSP